MFGSSLPRLNLEHLSLWCHLSLFGQGPVALRGWGLTCRLPSTVDALVGAHVYVRAWRRGWAGFHGMYLISSETLKLLGNVEGPLSLKCYVAENVARHVANTPQNKGMGCAAILECCGACGFCAEMPPPHTQSCFLRALSGSLFPGSSALFLHHLQGIPSSENTRHTSPPLNCRNKAIEDLHRPIPPCKDCFRYCSVFS